MAELDRFVDAQREVYDNALAELESGTKHTHWMWFIFPQLAGLGHSPTAQFYAISGLDEARAYLEHPLLGARLAQCTEAMLGWTGKRSAVAILGQVDAQKFRSSMTLFEVAAGDRPGARTFADALKAFCDGQRDERTLHLLGIADG
ncbi:DUF1810 domain-containing protein [Novosphingobium malaysiense]|uniref:Calpastatin n=1 Tax=Novosphingobium malaysiense TaxID=1348853 RepID=A0A0B1ZKX4_9SPHN|nr:DUF1810 domain-containing protein [Novosphingobium malaysiense]KHK89979.1 calpastatin [Novosphingobium malaysiense]